MFFTICIPSYNRAETLDRLFSSLARQTFTDFEVLLIDDGSIDNTSSIVESWQYKLPISYVYKENGGKHSAINKGLDLAEGKYFLILDSDDWLMDNGLEVLHSYASKINDDDNFSGVLARAQNYETGEMIGERIPSYCKVMSYIDFHFKIGRKYQFLDCCECNKTEIIKRYRFPEQEHMKFVPEAWLFDQIGLNYKLVCTNDIVRLTEYRNDGMTNDSEFKNKNYLGFLYHYTSRLEKIIPEARLDFKTKVIAWWRYWEVVKLDRQSIGCRVKKVTVLGKIIKILSPAINFTYKIVYSELYKRGR